MDEDEHPHGELGDRFVAMLQALDGATLDYCMDGPCGVHLGFQVVDSTHRVDILVCGWLDLMKHDAKKGVLICDGSNYLLREAVPQLPKGEVVTRFRAHPDKLAVRLSFAMATSSSSAPGQMMQTAFSTTSACGRANPTTPRCWTASSSIPHGWSPCPTWAPSTFATAR